MPHQCTGCGHAFEDGSKEMLSGCPSCGGKKFQFIPGGSPSPDSDGEQTTQAPQARTEERRSATEATDEGGRVERAASTLRGWVADDQSKDASPDSATEADLNEDTDSEIVVADQQTPESREDSAQAAARSTVVSREELPESPPPADDLEEAQEPDLETLRRELNEQFESIKILEPGQYELNLMELFDREERIIAIEEDGRYVIDVPEGWRDQEAE